jgi:transcriptional regulator with PAS, ATPase and Fis domain
VGKHYPHSYGECGIFQKGSVDGIECHLKHKEGFSVPVLKNARLVKDETGKTLGVVETVTDLTELNRTKLKIEEIGRKLREVHRLDRIIGKSHAMQQVFDAVKAAAASEATILIQGESGTGKELVAGAIHYNSNRVTKPLVTVNCSALSETLLESELFGHVKGAYTGAIKDRIGRFEEANGGTIFLDEIGEVSPYIQVKLLRVLQEREVERVGESKPRKIDIRIITASNKNLYDLIRKGSFREDLYYRLKVFPILVPSLRERKEDIPLLTSHFVEQQNKKTGKKIESLSKAATQILMDYNWPGNVRELENAIEHAFVLCNNHQIDTFDLPVEIRKTQFEPVVALNITQQRMFAKPGKHVTQPALLELLEACDWNKAEVARRLGVSRTAVWKYMKKWNISLQQPLDE